jgi:hypothetical protein
MSIEAFKDALLVRNIVARVVEAKKRRAEDDDAADAAKRQRRAGEWNLVVYKSRATRWDYTLLNPHGGSFGMSSYTSQKAAIHAATYRIKDWEGKSKIWVIIEEWDADKEDYVVKKTYWMDVPTK